MVYMLFNALSKLHCDKKKTPLETMEMPREEDYKALLRMAVARPAGLMIYRRGGGQGPPVRCKGGLDKSDYCLTNSRQETVPGPKETTTAYPLDTSFPEDRYKRPREIFLMGQICRRKILEQKKNLWE